MTINCVRLVVSVQYLRDKRPALDFGQPSLSLSERLKYPVNPYVQKRFCIFRFLESTEIFSKESATPWDEVFRLKRTYCFFTVFHH